MNVYLDRNFRTDVVTLGEIYNEKESWIFQTLERPWKDNERRISCIPTGTYTCRLGMYYGGDGMGGKRDYPAYEVTGVPKRDLIKIHVGNYVANVVGCIAIGMERDEETPMVKRSRIAYATFMDCLDDAKEFELVIRDV